MSNVSHLAEGTCEHGLAGRIGSDLGLGLFGNRSSPLDTLGDSCVFLKSEELKADPGLALYRLRRWPWSVVLEDERLVAKMF